MNFFLVSTDHLEDRIWFLDDDDFKAAMNLVAVVQYRTGVSILAFILMSNHVHFVLACSASEAKTFIDTLKNMYALHMRHKYGTPSALSRVGADLRELKLEGESLQRGIAYTEMNCVAANICPYPNMYSWGSGGTFFSKSPAKGQKLGTFSFRAQAGMLKSRAKLPQDYEVSEDGYVLPRSYIPVHFVESLFRTPNTYLHFLNSSSKARKHLEKDAAPSFRDQLVAGAIQDLCRSLFRTGGLSDLSDNQKSELFKQLRRRFSADIPQLSRVSGYAYEEIAAFLEAF